MCAGRAGHSVQARADGSVPQQHPRALPLSVRITPISGTVRAAAGRRLHDDGAGGGRFTLGRPRSRLGSGDFKLRRERDSEAWQQIARVSTGQRLEEA